MRLFAPATILSVSLILNELALSQGSALLWAGSNALALVLFGLDKFQAIARLSRIPELALLGLAVLAPFGALFGLVVFRHKTRKPMFHVAIGLGLAISFVVSTQRFGLLS